MEELALVPRGQPMGSQAESADTVEPVAEQLLARRKLLALEEGLGKLHKTARQQHDVVSQLENDMKSMISDTDLRRAIGLAFQELESRLEDAFADAGRKSLAMFSKRDEVAELQAVLAKKVNWTEYNTILKKLADLRVYIDTMAGSVFIGHRDLLLQEFAKKADKTVVEESLDKKADVEALDTTRARLERLETLVGHLDSEHSAKLEALRAQTNELIRIESEKQTLALAEQQVVIEALRQEHVTFLQRLDQAEGEIDELSAGAEHMREVQLFLEQGLEAARNRIGAMEEQLSHMCSAMEKTQREVKSLADDAKEFRETAESKFGHLATQAATHKDQIEFLMQATDMIKRRAREQTKSNTAKFEEVADEKEKLAKQLVAFEKKITKHERDLTSLEYKAGKAIEDGRPIQGALRALPAPESEDPNDRLKGVLDQLEKIASGGPPIEHMGIDLDPSRPPLPWGTGAGRRASELDLARFTGSAGPSPIDSARGLPTASARGGYSASPRPQGGTTKTPRKKKYTD